MIQFIVNPSDVIVKCGKSDFHECRARFAPHVVGCVVGNQHQPIWLTCKGEFYRCNKPGTKRFPSLLPKDSDHYLCSKLFVTI